MPKQADEKTRSVPNPGTNVPILRTMENTDLPADYTQALWLAADAAVSWVGGINACTEKRRQ